MKRGHAGLVIAAALVAGCLMDSWSSRRPVPGDDGSQWWEIQCHRDDEGCFAQIKIACPNGYEMKERHARKYYLIKCRDLPPATSSVPAPVDSF